MVPIGVEGAELMELDGANPRKVSREDHGHLPSWSKYLDAPANLRGRISTRIEIFLEASHVLQTLGNRADPGGDAFIDWCGKL
jgi:hypothetical protein